MRAKTTIVSFLLCALLVLSFALSAQAGATYFVQTSPLNAIENGVAEVMGDFSLSVNPAPLTTGIAVNDQITITYSGAAIANTATSGIVVTGTGAFAVADTFEFSVTANVGGFGGQVTIRFTNAFTPNISDTLTISGVRASVGGRPVAGLVITQMTGTPPGASSFEVTSSPTVAFVVDNISLTATALGVKVRPCAAAGTVVFPIKEESLTTFVQYVSPFAAPGPAGRSLTPFGANSNSQVHIHIENLQPGVTITWPASVLATPPGIGSLNRLSAETGSDAIYGYTTPDQAASDNIVEMFLFSVRHTHTGGRFDIAVQAATATGLTSTIQVQMYPSNADNTVIPRFDDPLTAAMDFIQCRPVPPTPR